MPLTIADVLPLGPPPTLTSAPRPKTKVTGPGTLASAPGPSTLYVPCATPKTAARPRSLALRRLTFTRKCVNLKMVPLAKVFSSNLSSSSFPSSTAPKANIVKRDATGERPQQLEGDSGSSRSVPSCDDHPLPSEPPPPYQLRVANPAPGSECEYDYDHIHGRGAAAMSSSSRFTAASVEAIRAPDSPVPTFPSPKLSTESVFGGSSTRSLASVSDYSVSAPADTNTNGTGATGTSPTFPEPRPRYICTLRNSGARGAAGPALKRKYTIGFARRVTLSSGSGYHSVKHTVSSAPLRS